MNNYIQIKVENISSAQSEILIAELSEIGFEGFEEGENFLSAYIIEEELKDDELEKIFSHHELTYAKNLIKQKNWNEEWEKDFKPVKIDDFTGVRADFHAPLKNVRYEIIITPKMSFGTGHHATTYLMMREMRKIDFKNKSVFDFGTGTGILAILAEKLGATNITAIDNDEWSMSNANENIARNDCKNIQLLLSDSPDESTAFDIILTNINKNIFLKYLDVLAGSLVINGHLLVSGLLIEDEAEIVMATNKLNLKHVDTLSQNKWICMKFTH